MEGGEYRKVFASCTPSPLRGAKEGTGKNIREYLEKRNKQEYNKLWNNSQYVYTLEKSIEITCRSPLWNEGINCWLKELIKLIQDEY